MSTSYERRGRYLVRTGSHTPSRPSGVEYLSGKGGTTIMRLAPAHQDGETDPTRELMQALEAQRQARSK